MVQAARQAGVKRFVFFSAQSASAHNRTRFMRAKALAERAVAESGVPHTIFAPSIVYAPGDVFLTLLERMALLPVVPISGSGRALFQPIWAEDVADCVMAALERPDGAQRYELSGPETLSYDAIAELVLRAAGRPRPLVHVPLGVVSRSLRTLEALMRSKRVRHLGRGGAHGGQHDRARGDRRRRGAGRGRRGAWPTFSATFDAQRAMFEPERCTVRPY